MHLTLDGCEKCICCLQTALKTLMVMHRIMRESNISFVEEVTLHRFQPIFGKLRMLSVLQDDQHSHALKTTPALHTTPTLHTTRALYTTQAPDPAAVLHVCVLSLMHRNCV